MSIRGLIIDNVKTTLEGITTGNGYNETVKLVETEHFKACDDLSAEQFPALFVIDTKEDKSPGDVDSVNCDLLVTITGYVKANSDNDNVQDMRRKLQNDVEKILMVDETRGGKAIFTEAQNIITDNGTLEPYSIFDMQVMINYYHNRNDPSNQDNSPT